MFERLVAAVIVIGAILWGASLLASPGGNDGEDPLGAGDADPKLIDVEDPVRTPPVVETEDDDDEDHGEGRGEGRKKKGKGGGD